MKPQKKLLTILSAVLLFSGCLTDQNNNEVLVGDQSFEVKVSQAIVGDKDSRTLMPKTHVDPSTVALVKGADAVVCTGTTIGLSHVITAAHCIYDKDTKEIKSGITLIPGLHLAENIKKGSRYFIKRIYVIEDYIKDINWNGYTKFASGKDIAVIQVKEFEGNTFFSDESPKTRIGLPSDFNHNDQKLDMIAYHYDDNTMEGSQYFVNPCYTKGKRSGASSVLHDCDTKETSSGAALVSNKKLYAIHTGSAGGSKYNSAAIITQSIYEDLDKITLYEKTGFKNFKVYEVNEDAYNSVSIKSNCSQQIRFSVAYKDDKGALRATVESDIPPYKLKLLNIETPESIAYIHAQTKDGSRKWDGSFGINFGPNRVLNFLTVDLKNHFGDTTLSLNCN